MREGWTYKKLGDFIEEYSVKNRQNEVIPVYSVTNSQGFCKEYFNKEVASQDKSTYKIVPYGAFAYNPSRINVGSVDWQNKEEKVIVSPLYNVFTVSERLNKDYLLFYIKSANTMNLINSLATGTVRLNLKLSMLKDFTIPLPPKSQQEAIVLELDEINSLLALKREQLQKYDKLAQSLFYEMFGDPVENDKGWEVKTIGECYEYIKNGANIKQEKGASGYPITRIETLSGGVFNRDRLGYANITDIKKYEQHLLKDNDLLLSHINSKTYIGRTVRYEYLPQEAIIHGMNLLRIKANERLIKSVYFEFFTKTDYYKDCIAKIRKDAVNQSSITVNDLKKIILPLPPLTLQQQFASRIEQIESQKQQVQAAIEKLETLLASRMQYWFD